MSQETHVPGFGGSFSRRPELGERKGDRDRTEVYRLMVLSLPSHSLPGAQRA